MTTKSQLKAAYISALQARYPFYTVGSRPLVLAYEAVDAALAGQMKLKGECWDKALSSVGLSTRITLNELAALPAEEA